VNVRARSLEARNVDSFFGEANLFSFCGLETWKLNSGTAGTNFLLVGRLDAGRVYGSLEVGFFAVAWLDTGAVFTFGDVDLTTFVSATFRTFDVDCGIVMIVVMVMMCAVWKLDFDVS